MLGTPRRRTRCALVWAAGTGALAGAVVVAGPRAVQAVSAARTHSLGGLALDRALGDLSAAVTVVCGVWAWLAMTATVLEALREVRPPGAAERRRVPSGLRRLVLAACGVAVVSATTSGASAADGAHRAVPAAAHRTASGALTRLGVVAGLPLPDRAVAPARTGSPRISTATAPPDRPPRRGGTSVVVSRGDTLWSIAAAGLPVGASDQRISHRWHEIYAANRAEIGPDPDLIRPGQRLKLFVEQPRGDDRR